MAMRGVGCGLVGVVWKRRWVWSGRGGGCVLGGIPGRCMRESSQAVFRAGVLTQIPFSQGDRSGQIFQESPRKGLRKETGSSKSFSELNTLLKSPSWRFML